MQGVIPSVEYNEQIKKVVRESISGRRSASHEYTSRHNKQARPALYITHEELRDVVTPTPATRLKQSVYTAAQIVLSDDSDFRVTIQGIESDVMHGSSTATEIRAVLQLLLPNLDFEVWRYTGRVLIACTTENSTALASIALSDVGNGYAQQCNWKAGTTRDVLAISATSSDPIPPGTLCFGNYILGLGDRMIPECRSYSGDEVTPTSYMPPVVSNNPFNAFTGFSVCDSSPSGNLWTKTTTVEPTESNDLEIEFTGGNRLIPAAKWSRAANGGDWDIIVELTNATCDFHNSGFAITSGSPSGTPARWRHP